MIYALSAVVALMACTMLAPTANRLLAEADGDAPTHCWAVAFDGGGHKHARMYEDVAECEATSPNTLFVKWPDGQSRLETFAPAQIVLVEVGRTAKGAERQPLPTLFE